MGLTLRSLDDNTVRRLGDGALTIGRGPDNDLVIVDPSREVSKTHCRIEGGGAAYTLIDLSINGVRIEGRGSGEPMGAGMSHALASGDVFVIGRRRFAVTIGDGDVEAQPPSSAFPAAPPPVALGAILGGRVGDPATGGDARASAAVTGEAQGWLGDLPSGAADETIRRPMGWDAPPAAAGAAVVPDAALPLSTDFADRSERLSALNAVLPMPTARPDARSAAAPLAAPPSGTPVLPMDWFEEEVVPPPARPSPAERPHDPRPSASGVGFDAPAEAPAPPEDPPPPKPLPPAPRLERGDPSGTGGPAGPPKGAAPTPLPRQALADGGRFDGSALAGIGDAELMRRCGEALRSIFDGLDALEAAQAVAEHDCGLPTPAAAELWIDFFASNRDPLLLLLAEAQPGPAQVLLQRVAALADRQRALGRAVADAAQRYDAALAPAVIEAETRSRLRAGPLGKIAAWSRYASVHAELAGTDERGEPLPSFLVLLRKRFARALNKPG